MKSLFNTRGLHVLVDGQYGSTGKGALAAWLANEAVTNNIDFKAVMSNAGPNSGHTFYLNGEKHVLKQLPSFAAVYSMAGGVHIPVYLTAGAIIDPAILRDEALRYPGLLIFVNPNAAVITPEDKAAEHSGTVAAVAGTRSGTGAAIARKVLRDPLAVVAGHGLPNMPDNVHVYAHDPDIAYYGRVFMEISQGFSLGLNDPKFYPKVTSRECTVAQGIADARMPPQSVKRTYMSIRTFPIRVGHVDGFHSGSHYPDQVELEWEGIGVEPERTTVTNRVRRVFSFSDRQFTDALWANYPDFVSVNFLNYLSPEAQEDFVDRIRRLRDEGPYHFGVIGGFGPKIEDFRLL